MMARVTVVLPAPERGAATSQPRGGFVGVMRRAPSMIASIMLCLTESRAALSDIWHREAIPNELMLLYIRMRGRRASAATGLDDRGLRRRGSEGGLRRTLPRPVPRPGRDRPARRTARCLRVGAGR